MQSKRQVVEKSKGYHKPFQIYQNLPKELQNHIDFFKFKTHLPEQIKNLIDSSKFKALIWEVAHYAKYVCIWEFPSNQLIYIVNKDKYCLQHGYTDFEKFIIPNGIAQAKCEISPLFEFGVNCLHCLQERCFPCRNCSTNILGDVIKPGAFFHHNFKAH